MKHPSRLARTLVALAVSLLLVASQMPPVLAASPSPVNAITESGNLELYNALREDPYNLDPAHTGNITDIDLASLTGEIKLFNKNLKSLEGLQYAVNATVLALTGNNDLTDIAPVCGMVRLEELYVAYTGVSNLPSGLSSLSNLRHLSCGWSPITENDANRSVILSLPNVKALNESKPFSLVLDSFTDMSFLSPAAAPGLSLLVWGGYEGRGASKFDTLSALTQLKGLILSFDSAVGAPGSTVLETIALHLPGLTSLGLQQCGITSLSAISGMTGLEYLTITNNQICDLGPLSGMTKLNMLIMNQNYVNDLTPLSGLANLTQLIADENYLDPTPGSADRAILDKINARKFATYNNQRQITVHFDAAPYANPADKTTYYGAKVTLPNVAGLPANKAACWDTNNDGTGDRFSGDGVAFTWPVIPVPSNEVTYKGYYINIDASKLLRLGNSAGTLSPAFSPNKTSYTLTLGENTASARLAPVKAKASSKLYINGALTASKTFTLKPGKSTVATIKVVSATGAKTVYTVVIKRKAISNAYLKSLKAGYPLQPSFSKTVYAYTVNIPVGKPGATVTAVKADASATVTINGSKTSSKFITVGYGQSKTVTIVVKAQAGNTKTYKVTLKRPPKP